MANALSTLRHYAWAVRGRSLVSTGITPIPRIPSLVYLVLCSGHLVRDGYF